MGYSTKRNLEEKITLYSSLGSFSKENFEKDSSKTKYIEKNYNIGINLLGIIGNGNISYTKQEKPKRDDTLILPSHFLSPFLSDLRAQDVPDSQPPSQEEIQEELHKALCPWINQE